MPLNCRVRCLPGLLCTCGAFDETQKQSLKLNPRRLSWRNLCFPTLCSSSFLELSLCTQTGWVPQGSSEVPSMPWGALPGQSSRLASAPGGCAELLTDPDFWGVELRLWSCSNWGSRRKSCSWHSWNVVSNSPAMICGCCGQVLLRNHGLRSMTEQEL